MFKKTVRFEHSIWGAKAGIVQNEVISFNRFSRQRNRVFYKAIDPKRKLGVRVNRFGAIKSYIVRGDLNV